LVAKGYPKGLNLRVLLLEMNPFLEAIALRGCTSKRCTSCT